MTDGDGRCFEGTSNDVNRIERWGETFAKIKFKNFSSNFGVPILSIDHVARPDFEERKRKQRDRENTKHTTKTRRRRRRSSSRRQSVKSSRFYFSATDKRKLIKELKWGLRGEHFADLVRISETPFIFGKVYQVIASEKNGLVSDSYRGAIWQRSSSKNMFSAEKKK